MVQMTVPGPAAKRGGKRPVWKASLLGNSAAFLVMMVAFNWLTSMLSTRLFALPTALPAPSTER